MMTFRESETLELKKSTSELKEAVVSVAAILNKHGRGELYFGVKNDGTAIGQHVSEKTVREVSHAISEGIEPKVYPEIGKVKIDGKDCIAVSFSGGYRPYFAFGRAYMRVGDENRQLSAAELEKIILDKKNDSGKMSSWDAQPSDCGMRDIGQKAVREFVGRANSAGRIDFKFQGVEATLKKLGLARKGRLTRAAQVLFSSKNPLKVQAAVFAGVEKLTFLDIQQFEGQNLFELLKTSEEYVKKHIMWRVKFGKLEREEIPEIPIDALREALINSLCHRDYQSPQSNYIAIYKDRMEIDNPGSFPENLEPEDYIFKNEPSIPRNPLIAEALYRTKDIEMWGSGLKRIFDECKENEVKVEFRKMKDGFKVIFHRREGHAENARMGQKGARKGPERGQKLLDEIKQNPHIGRRELAEILSIGEKAVRHHIEILKKKGLLKRIGPDKGGHWEITTVKEKKLRDKKKWN